MIRPALFFPMNKQHGTSDIAGIISSANLVLNDISQVEGPFGLADTAFGFGIVVTMLCVLSCVLPCILSCASDVKLFRV